MPPPPSPDDLGTCQIRNATAADLPRVAQIWYEGVGGGQPAAPALRGVPSLYAHELDAGELSVLEEDGQVVAFASVVHRGGIAFLADLFVAAAARSRGHGQRLLRASLPRDDRTCCTVSSNDPRALPLYIRSGLRPRWPLVQLRLPAPTMERLGAGLVRVVEAELDDPWLGRWDTALGGRDRPRDRRYWAARRGGVPLWCRRQAQTVGYAIVQTVSDDVLDRADVVTVGPMGVRDGRDAVECVAAVVEWARGRGRPIRISLLGPHPALAPLLRAGARIASVETFCANADAPFVDPLCYVPSGGDLF